NNDPINHHDPSGHMDIPKEGLATGEGHASTGRLKRLTLRRKQAEPGQEKQEWSPVYKAVQKRLRKAESSAPVMPASKRYLDALVEARVKAKRRPKNKLRRETANLLEALYYHASGGGQSDYEEAAGYNHEALLGRGGLTGDEYKSLRSDSIVAFSTTIHRYNRFIIYASADQIGTIDILGKNPPSDSSRRKSSKDKSTEVSLL
ncbi:MAG: hypothetical protein ABW153_13875, partial [Sedimenticola sp.]